MQVAGVCRLVPKGCGDGMILDPTCSARSIWFDKDREDVVYGDKRIEDLWVGKGKNGRQWNVRPDVQLDFTSLPFRSGSFEMVVFDPPHLKDLGETSWLYLKYGKLLPGWQDMIRAGFSECFRVLRSRGVLVFKWNENQVKVSEVLSLTNLSPMFGHTTGSKSKTHWLTFIKDSA